MALNLTYDECFTIALKYKTKQDFRLNEAKVYAYAYRNEWLKDYTWLKHASKIERLYEKCSDKAKLYTNVDDFHKFDEEQYKIALKYRWLKDFDWLEDTARYDRCYQIAEKYTSLKEFRLKERSTYVIALQNNWINDYTWLQRKYKKTNYKWSKIEYAEKYSYENCLEMSKQYKTVREFKDDNFICYNKCRRNGWLEDCVWLENDIRAEYNKLTYEDCYECAKQCTSKTEMREKHWPAFRKAVQEDWIVDYTWFNTVYMTQKCHFCIYAYEDKANMTVYIGLTKDIQRRHRQHANKVPCKDHYDRVKTYFLLQGKDLPMYDILSENLTSEEAQFYEALWIETYKNHGWFILNKAKVGKGSSSLGSYVNKWTKDVCLERAKKYNTMIDFMMQDNGAYQACCRNGWIHEINWMTKNTLFKRTPVPILELNDDGEIVNRFESITEAMKKCNLTPYTMRNVLHNGEKLKNGNFLKKEEENFAICEKSYNFAHENLTKI